MANAEPANVATPTSAHGSDSDAPLPFEHLFWPIVLRARDKLRRTADVGNYDLLTPHAHADWERYLLLRLTVAGAKAAHWQFQTYRTVRSAFPVGEQQGLPVNSDLYRRFVGSPAGSLRKLFDEFPAFERLSSTLVENWVETVREFLVRLHGDRGGLSLQVLKQDCTSPVSNVETALGDPHRGGRCVVRVRFENGASVIYKPRSLMPEAEFATFLDWLNSNIPYALRSARCWSRDGYGWMEDIRPSSCNTIAEIRAFYWRAGALLGLIHLARGVDFHCENLIAAGEFPVLVDLEALLHPQEIGGSDLPAAKGASLLRTGFLPLSKQAGVLDYGWSALSAQSGAKRPMTFWNRVNQDDMALETAWRTFQDRSNVPEIAGVKYAAAEFRTEIEAGYKWMGNRLLSNKTGTDDLLRWLSGLGRCPRRWIVRPTVRYKAALERHTSPLLLRKLSCDAEAIMPPVQNEQAMSAFELRALAQLDIPYFTQPEQASVSLDNDPERYSEKHYQSQSTVIADALVGRA